MSARPAFSPSAKPLKFLGWLLVALTAASWIAAHAGVDAAARLTSILATLALTAAFVGRIGGRFRAPLRALALLAGAALIVALLRGHVQTLPPLLLPVLIPLLLAWTFGRTLLPGRRPLIERIACAVHEVPELTPRMRRYTRRVTLLWTALFVALVAGNGWLLVNAEPGGLFALAGRAAPWPVPLATCARLSAGVMLVLIPAVFVVEYVVRLARFPDYRFRDPLEFLHILRRRWPAIAASLRDE